MRLQVLVKSSILTFLPFPGSAALSWKHSINVRHWMSPISKNRTRSFRARMSFGRRMTTRGSGTTEYPWSPLPWDLWQEEESCYSGYNPAPCREVIPPVLVWRPEGPRPHAIPFIHFETLGWLYLGGGDRPGAVGSTTAAADGRPPEARPGCVARELRPTDRNRGG